MIIVFHLFISCVSLLIAFNRVRWLHLIPTYVLGVPRTPARGAQSRRSTCKYAERVLPRKLANDSSSVCIILCASYAFKSKMYSARQSKMVGQPDKRNIGPFHRENDTNKKREALPFTNLTCTPSQLIASIHGRPPATQRISLRRLFPNTSASNLPDQPRATIAAPCALACPMAHWPRGERI